MESLVSVIIPVFRVEDYLNRCVESVIRQTYSNLEIILVDDGSDDRCPAMCDEWKTKDSRIRVIHKPNGGLSDARNAGLKIVAGEYIYFLDSDDYIVDNAIERMVHAMIEHHADAVAFGYTKIDEDNQILSAVEFSEKKYEFSNQEDKLKFMYQSLLQYRLGWEAWNRMYKTSIIKDNNLWYEPNKEIFAEDRCFNLYYTLCSNNIFCLNEKLHFYLIRQTSIMGQNKEWKINESINLVKKVYGLAQKLQYDYIVKHHDYITYCIVGKLIFLMKTDEYSYYAAKIEDKNFCKASAGGVQCPFMFIRIWGKKIGIANYIKYQRFIKKL